ncbi:uncharacterized protein LOC143238277 isoform X6 [Tachypleus tridentatus]|uniref:uncharacterized protein LOC143238277 isoform X6 n=1 Tax=Tachypleus tridentatus TaxID=6853 RepID=UPI003FCF39FC
MTDAVCKCGDPTCTCIEKCTCGKEDGCKCTTCSKKQKLPVNVSVQKEKPAVVRHALAVRQNKIPCTYWSGSCFMNFISLFTLLHCLFIVFQN